VLETFGAKTFAASIEDSLQRLKRISEAHHAQMNAGSA